MTQTEEYPRLVDAETTPGEMNGHAVTLRGSKLFLVAGPTVPEELQNGALGPVLGMGSKDSTANATGGTSCGLVSSLFPSSCRGRAEAFARRLHHRLTSLGGEDDGRKEGNCLKLSETSWLHTNANVPSHNHVLERQPRHSSDSDLYFDFDIEDDVLGSPAEEATDAELEDLLLNPESLKIGHHEACHCSPSPRPIPNQDPESGCIFSSPATGTSPESDSSEVFFDPDTSSDADKTADSFYDPETSESDVSNMSNGGSLIAKVLAHRHSSPRPVKSTRKIPQEAESSDSSESTGKLNHVNVSREEQSSSETPKVSKAKDLVKRIASSEDSLNGRSSQDTTSPSHESLWSTFDDSTVSLQEESPSRVSSTPVVPHHVHKSHSDSEIPRARCKADVQFTQNDPVHEVNEVDFVNGDTVSSSAIEEVQNIKNLSKCALETPDIGRESSEIGENGIKDEHRSEKPLQDLRKKGDRVEGLSNSLVDIGISNLQVQSSDDGQSDTDTDHSTYSSTINIPGALTLECPSGTRVPDTEITVKNEVRLQIENGTVMNGDDENIAELLKRLGRDSIHAEEESNKDDITEEEEEQERPQRVRRCSSLKTGKTPPGTPGRKKIVRFADVLGLDLADVRTFLDEIPKVPNSAYSDLIYDDYVLKQVPSHSYWNARYSECQSTTNPTRVKPDRTLVPMFQQPGGLANFLDIVRERQVCLENVLVQDPIAICLQGTVRVRNLDFHKSVHIRYTLNCWQSFSDLQATYVPNSCDGFSDKFSFILYCHTLNVGQRLELAVRFQCKGKQYWDNNGGSNYCFQCLPTAPSSGYIPITSPENVSRDWAPTFY